MTDAKSDLSFLTGGPEPEARFFLIFFGDNVLPSLVFFPEFARERQQRLPLPVDAVSEKIHGSMTAEEFAAHRRQQQRPWPADSAYEEMAEAMAAEEATACCALGLACHSQVRCVWRSLVIGRSVAEAADSVLETRWWMQ